jgi:hypothetical protein
MVQIILLAVAFYAIKVSSKHVLVSFLYKFVNLQFILTVKILTIPFIGLSMIVLYCDPKNPYHLGQTCYDGIHIAYCALSIFIIVFLIIQNFVNTFYFYTKSPLYFYFLAQPNNYYSGVKFLIKILLPLYFLIDPFVKYSDVYSFAILGAFAAYLFFLRLFSTCNYNKQHFYFVLNL